MLPENGHLSGIHSVMLNSTDEDTASPSTLDEDEDPYSTHLSGSFVPSTTQWVTEQETVRQTMQLYKGLQERSNIQWLPLGICAQRQLNLLQVWIGDQLIIGKEWAW